ncbi:MAG TPA: DUF2975 domain-containing protein [Allosphingosinicella sp.]|jgi:hypothetical protein|nr:DUF2975 domain-containing protein [Allosphingosinicella sp.]
MKAFFTQFSNDLTARRGGLDPLLTAARILLYVFLAGVILSGIFSLIGLAVYVAAQTSNLFLTLDAASWQPVGAHLLGLTALGLIGSSVQSLLGMIGSVERGDTFDGSNADRLKNIAGNLLGLQLLGWIAALAGSPIGGDINGFDIGLKLSPGGIAVVLLLFILARVFRQGTMMRDDLAGTV